MKQLFLCACISMLSSNLYSMDKPSLWKKISSYLQQKADSMQQSYKQSYAQGYLAANQTLMGTWKLENMDQERYGKALLRSYEILKTDTRKNK